MANLFPTCAESARRISLAEDARLSLQSRVGLYLHLAACSFCRRYLKQVRFLRGALKAQGGEFGSHSRQHLSNQARQRIIGALSENA